MVPARSLKRISASSRLRAQRAGLAFACLLALAAFGATRDAPSPTSATVTPALVPIPQQTTAANTRHLLAPTLRCRLSDASLVPLVDVLDYEYRMLSGGQVRIATRADEENCRLSIDPALEEQEYRLSTSNMLDVSGGSYLGVAMGTVALMQSLQLDGRQTFIAELDIRDRPDKVYRGLMVDVARYWHDIETLEQVVKLCRWYKVNYLQIHLTDDQSFTFPTEALPALATPGRHYTKRQLRELDAFARAHGVTLVPELDVPGHATQLTQRMPKVFGLSDVSKNPATINMGREEVYQALDLIIGEIAAVFETSPYIHIGGDEASLEAVENDPDVQRYLAAHGLENAQELYRHFLVRMDALVQKHGKRTLLWEGFHKEGAIAIPKNITVMAWETKYQLPQDLLEGGYDVINASWKPLYVVNQKKWDAEYIYGWNVYRWENWVEGMPSLTPIQLPENARVIGASMESWEQPQHSVLSSLRRRLPAMSERAWNASLEPKHSLETFLRGLQQTDAKLQRILTPLTLAASGLRFPGREDGHYNEPYWFGDKLTLQLAANPEHVIRYTLDGTPPSISSPRYSKPVELSDEGALRARAFSKDGAPIGYEIWNVYELHPLEASVDGELAEPLSVLWEHRTPIARFADEVTVTLESQRDGTIRYTIDGSRPSPSSWAYRVPLRIAEKSHIRAQLFGATGAAVGREWEQQFEKVAPTTE